MIERFTPQQATFAAQLDRACEIERKIHDARPPEKDEAIVYYAPGATEGVLVDAPLRKSLQRTIYTRVRELSEEGHEDAARDIIGRHFNPGPPTRPQGFSQPDTSESQ